MEVVISITLSIVKYRGLVYLVPMFVILLAFLPALEPDLLKMYFTGRYLVHLMADSSCILCCFYCVKSELNMTNSTCAYEPDQRMGAHFFHIFRDCLASNYENDMGDSFMAKNSCF